MDIADSLSSFPEWLKIRRRMLDLTQEELAQRSGCSVFALRKIESGERRPSKQLAGLLAMALEIPPEDQQTFIRVARGELNLERMRKPGLTRAGVYTSRPRVAERPAHPNLESELLVGREPEMAALKRLFSDPRCRLLTLTGLGGIGKTRLAAGFASSQASMFPGGVYPVPLASTDSAELMIPAIAEAMGLSFSGPVEPKEQVFNYLASCTHEPILLVLDNLEQLLTVQLSGGGSPEVVRLIGEILQRLPQVKILATSRVPLNLQGEWMYELHGLPAPPNGYTGELEQFGAVTLFELSAQRIRVDFRIEAEEREALIRICNLVEGIPLAIELAAAWIGMLSCEEIADEIQTNIDFLRTTLHDVPERHRSIRATFDHSWKLLTEEERCAMQRLSVFHGGFTRQAAEKVAGASLLVLASLHSKSLIRRGESGRYDLHELIRQYAGGHFEGDPQYLEVCERHCDYYLGLVREREKALKSKSQQKTVQELGREMDNVRAAWAWALDQEKYTLIGGSLRCCAWLCDVTGWIREGIDQMEPFIQALRTRADQDETRKLLGHALAQLGLLYFRKGEFGRAQAHWEESLGILRPFDDPEALTCPLVFHSILTHLMGDLQGAQALVEQGKACAKASGDWWFEAYAIFNQGHMATLGGDYAGGYEQMLRGLQSWRERGDPSSIALGLNYISPTAIKLGYLDEAQAFLEESLALSQEIGDRWSTGTAYRNLGLTALARGDTDEAETRLKKSLEIFGDYIVGWDIARSLTYLGDVAVARGDLEEAGKIYVDGMLSALEAKSPPVALEALAGLGGVQLLKEDFEAALETASFIQSQPASSLDARELADKISLEASQNLDEECRQRVKERSAQQSLETFLNRYGRRKG